VQNNVDFLGEQMQWALQPRAAGLVQLQEHEIENGDYLAITRLDGIDPMIMFGTGGHTGHTAVAMWFEDGLHICESTDVVGNHPYWPAPYGVIRTPFKQWVQQAMDANYLVGVLRLAPEYRQRFNNATAAEWFFQVQGMPYGWHNFFFSFMYVVMCCGGGGGGGGGGGVCVDLLCGGGREGVGTHRCEYR
jgi:hypothetical protein